ncbi:MAG: hypothetical protein ABSD63_12600 [Candidatus Korobacteraceae bacterium]|jgi:hypothetical protein
MRYILCAALFCSLLGAQDKASVPPLSPRGDGIFYVNGIDYHFLSGTNYTVVVAAHSVANRKFLGVKVRILNNGQHSVTVRPEDVRVEDAVAGREVAAISGAELANKMRRPYNWSRYAVSAATGPAPAAGDGLETADRQHSDLMRAMRQMASQMDNAPPVLSTRSFTETDGEPDSAIAPQAMLSDEVSHLRMKEASRPDVLMQLQRQVSPDYVERTSFMANTIPSRADVDGVFYYPMGKLARNPAATKKAAKSRVLRVTVPVGEENFQFMLAVE